MDKTRKFIATLLIFLFVQPSFAGDNPAESGGGYARDLPADAIDLGLKSLYELDYESARKHFQNVVDRSPNESMGYYALATAYWWELTNEFDEKNPALEQAFLDAAEKTVATAKARIKEGDPRGENRLCLGGALGLRSRWDAIQSKWIKAYFDGKAAYKAQKEAVEINPQMYDAYLGLGIFHYYTATLPSVVKVLASLVIAKGNKEEGLREIYLAMDKGRFSRTPAKLFLVGIYNNTEKDYAKALALVREGRKEYPNGSFFPLIEMLTLENLKDWPALRAEALDYIARVEKGETGFRKTHMHRGYFCLGNSYLGEGNAAEAEKIYSRVLKEFHNEDRWVSWTYLNRGKAYDLLGRRQEALADYKAVLKRRDVWQLHDQAKVLIDEPYKQLSVISGQPSGK